MFHIMYDFKVDVYVSYTFAQINRLRIWQSVRVLRNTLHQLAITSITWDYYRYYKGINVLVFTGIIDGLGYSERILFYWYKYSRIDNSSVTRLNKHTLCRSIQLFYNKYINIVRFRISKNHNGLINTILLLCADYY